MQIWNRYKIPKDLQATYIGRGTPWGNPFKVGEGYEQGEAADAYRKYLATGLACKEKKFTQLVVDLNTVEHITCSCKPKPCHGDCYVEIRDKIIEADGDIKQGIRNWVKENGFPFGPDGDGIDHINIYSKGKTSIGRAMTNMSAIPVTIPGEGTFQSVEAYWYWLSTGMKDDRFFTVDHFEAKNIGKSMPRVPIDNFEEKIKRAIKLKLDQFDPRMKRALKNSTLPLTHYYHYGDDKSVAYTRYDWIIDYISELRAYYQKTWHKCVIAGTRGFKDYAFVRQAILESGFPITEVVSGKEKSGVDALGERYAEDNFLAVDAKPADWDTHGKAAGMIRNREMAKTADSGIVICVNSSPGSMNMIAELKKLGKPVKEYHIKT